MMVSRLAYKLGDPSVHVVGTLGTTLGVRVHHAYTHAVTSATIF